MRKAVSHPDVTRRGKFQSLQWELLAMTWTTLRPSMSGALRIRIGPLREKEDEYAVVSADLAVQPKHLKHVMTKLRTDERLHWRSAPLATDKRYPASSEAAQTVPWASELEREHSSYLSRSEGEAHLTALRRTNPRLTKFRHSGLWRLSKTEIQGLLEVLRQHATGDGSPTAGEERLTCPDPFSALTNLILKHYKASFVLALMCPSQVAVCDINRDNNLTKTIRYPASSEAERKDMWTRWLTSCATSLACASEARCIPGSESQQSVPSHTAAADVANSSEGAAGTSSRDPTSVESEVLLHIPEPEPSPLWKKSRQRVSRKRLNRARSKKDNNSASAATEGGSTGRSLRLKEVGESCGSLESAAVSRAGERLECLNVEKDIYADKESAERRREVVKLRQRELDAAFDRLSAQGDERGVSRSASDIQRKGCWASPAHDSGSNQSQPLPAVAGPVTTDSASDDWHPGAAPRVGDAEPLSTERPPPSALEMALAAYMEISDDEEANIELADEDRLPLDAITPTIAISCDLEMLSDTHPEPTH